MYGCFDVTCHLHVWQNDRGLLCATAVTQELVSSRTLTSCRPHMVTSGRGNTRMERTPNISQHRKLILVKKIPPPLLPGLKLTTFWSQVLRSTIWAIPTLNNVRQLEFPIFQNFWSYPRTERNTGLRYSTRRFTASRPSQDCLNYGGFTSFRRAEENYINKHGGGVSCSPTDSWHHNNDACL